MDKIIKLIEYSIRDNIFHGILNTEKGKFLNLYISLYNKEFWRIQLSEESPKNNPVHLFPSSFNVREEGEFVLMEGEEIDLYILKSPFFFFFKKGEEVILSLDNHRNVGLLHLTPPLAKNEIGFCGTFSLDSEDRIFGLGEFFTPCERHSQELEVWVNDAYGTFTQRAYKPLPFSWSTKGYGILFNTNYKTKHYIAHPDKNLSGYYFEDYSSILDIFLFFGKEPKEIIKKYHILTGKPEIPPFWSFGLWMSRCYYWDEKTVLEVAETLREKNIPCDVINLDGRAWLRHGYQTDFQWDLERYPDPKRLISRLKELGFRVCLWENPYISEKSPLFYEAEKNGFLLKDLNGQTKKIKWVPEEFQGLHNPPSAGIVDLTNPKAREWYKDLHRPLLRMGIDTFKTDFGEEIPEDVIAYNGMKGDELHNYYAFIYNQVVYEVVKEEKKEGLVWGRSGYIGSQTIPVQWAGDTESSYEGMFTSLRGGLSYGLSGGNLLWAHDLGGFYGAKPDSQLYIRWSEFALLNPLVRAHGTTPREPWEYGKEAERIFKKFTFLRYSLLPYIYSSAVEGKETSLPVMRHLILEFPKDPISAYIEDEYLLGDDILIAPIFTNKNERKIYLPRCRWYDFWDKDYYDGEKVLEKKVPLSRIPIFIKEGAIIPRFIKIGRNTEELEEKYLVEIWFPNEKKEKTFYTKNNTFKIKYEMFPDYMEFDIESQLKTDFIVHILGFKNIREIDPGIDYNYTPNGILFTIKELQKINIKLYKE